MKKNILLVFLLFGLLNVRGYSQNEDNHMVEIITPHGTMIVELYNETPRHRDNFLNLVSEGYYDGQLFHRVINNFMIQAGDPNSKNADKGEMLGMGGPDYTLPAEFSEGLYHKKGALAAARKGDAVNPEKRSSGSQFYIVQGKIYDHMQLNQLQRSGRHGAFTQEQIDDYTTNGGTPFLDDNYTVFGEVVEGLEVIDKIASVTTDNYDRPVEDITITMRVIR